MLWPVLLTIGLLATALTAFVAVVVRRGRDRNGTRTLAASGSVINASPSGEKLGVLARDTVAGFVAEVVVTPLSPEHRRIRELGIRATDLKKTDIRAAVDCLKEAQAIARRINAHGYYPIDFWLRLPLFLQQAGEPEAAEVIFSQIERDIRAGLLCQSHTAKTAYLRKLESKRRLAAQRKAKAMPRTA